MFHVTVRPMLSGESRHCEAILRALPRWFGIEEALVDYVRASEVMETHVATIDERVVGFATVRQHFPQAAEIHVMGVQPEAHGRGVGRALVEHVEEIARRRGAEFLQVKTLGPSRPNEDYERTRGFYTHLGFTPLEENDLWGEANPCLILVKHLSCGQQHGTASGRPSDGPRATLHHEVEHDD